MVILVRAAAAALDIGSDSLFDDISDVLNTNGLIRRFAGALRGAARLGKPATQPPGGVSS
jgi:hypothetical protein